METRTRTSIRPVEGAPVGVGTTAVEVSGRGVDGAPGRKPAGMVRVLTGCGLLVSVGSAAIGDGDGQGTVGELGTTTEVKVASGAGVGVAVGDGAAADVARSSGARRASGGSRGRALRHETPDTVTADTVTANTAARASPRSRRA
ncbi:MAG: hypothetical protein HYV63_16315 [Candidatus Schekmanbacteria bacterium]|nr:hypothetical protein [Candidatus Schekmanbacteria bacterium]